LNAGPSGALHVAGDYQKVGRVTRKPINGGDDDKFTVCKGGHELFKLRLVGGRASDLLAEYLSHPAAFNWASWWVRPWAPVETRA
jgi:hypothetical protein